MKIDAQDYDSIARTVFAPVYPVIADQIIEKTNVTQGTCLDIGCGGGYLGLALARKTNLFVRLFDNAPDMLTLARKAVNENGLDHQVNTLCGEVSKIPLPDNAIDLVVSRGSMFFWEDIAAAFKEIFRVLAAGGWAYVGGGFGSRQLKETIEAEMKLRNNGSDQFSKKIRGNLGPEARARFETLLYEAGIPSFTIVQSEDIGLWFIIDKA